MSTERVSAWNEMRPLLQFSDVLNRAVRVPALQSRDRRYNDKECRISLHVVSGCLVAGSDCGECLATSSNIVVPREVSNRPSRVLKICENYALRE